MCIVTPKDLRSETWRTGLMTSRPRSYPMTAISIPALKGSIRPTVCLCVLSLLTSNTRTFHMGVPSFSIGAEGRPPAGGASSFSVEVTSSFRLRIFLIETGGEGGNKLGMGYNGLCQGIHCWLCIRICLSRSALPRAAIVDAPPRDSE